MQCSSVTRGSFYISSLIGLAALSLASCGGASGLNPFAGKAGSGHQVSASSQYDLKTELKNAPENGAKLTSSTLQANFNVAGSDAANPNLKFESFQCRVGASTEWVPCGGNPFVLSGLRTGAEYTLTVRAILRDVKTQALVIAQEVTTSFVVDAAQGEVAPGATPIVGLPTVMQPTGRTLASTLQVGSFYRARVPAGMHVTEYSTSKTTGVLSVFRVLPESDPYYLGNFTCNKSWDRLVNAITPAGQTLAYCHSTPTRAVWKAEHEYRLAMNHVEVATDADQAKSDNYERLSVSIYDADRELMRKTSRFYNACLNSKVESIRVPMINNFFIGKNPEMVTFYYCDTILAGPNGESETWRIGSFYDNDAVDWNCDDCSWNRGVEVTYMARANSDIFLTDDFAKVSQKRVLDLLEKVRP